VIAQKTEKWCEGTRSDPPFKNMEQIKVGDWCYLVWCKNCGQLWQVDAWDKYSYGLAIKYSGTIEDWKRLSDIDIRKEAMIINHGGLSDNECQWSRCKNKALKDMAICVEHAYKEMGIRW
jgi:hypothetical protein